MYINIFTLYCNSRFFEILQTQHILKEQGMSWYEGQQWTQKVNGNYDTSFNLMVAMLPTAFKDQICSDDQNTCVF